MLNAGERESRLDYAAMCEGGNETAAFADPYRRISAAKSARHEGSRADCAIFQARFSKRNIRCDAIDL